MCLILLGWQAAAEYPLIVAANRDEFHARPTRPAQVWPEIEPALIAGQDLQAGGTWMGITAGGRFAAVTNYREAAQTQSSLSRGQLVTDFLQGSQTAEQYARVIHAEGPRYAGFNLLVADHQQLLHISNRSPAVTRISPGIHGLSNASLNTPWPKVQDGKAQLQQVINRQVDHQPLQDILADQEIAGDDQLPSTGVALELERLLSARKIVSPGYGTRSSTTLLLSTEGQINFYEQRYAASGDPDGHSHIVL